MKVEVMVETAGMVEMAEINMKKPELVTETVFELDELITDAHQFHQLELMRKDFQLEPPKSLKTLTFSWKTAFTFLLFMVVVTVGVMDMVSLMRAELIWN
jgi:hypothetical protein